MRVLLLGGTAGGRALAAHAAPGRRRDQLAGGPGAGSRAAGRARCASAGSAASTGCGGGWSIPSVDAVVDATHPYAATITAHAAQVCGELGLPHLVLARPALATR